MKPGIHRVVTIVSVVKGLGCAYGRFEDNPDPEVWVPFDNKRGITIFRGGVYFTRESGEGFIKAVDTIVATVEQIESFVFACEVFKATCWIKKEIWDRQELMADLASKIT